MTSVCLNGSINGIICISSTAENMRAGGSLCWSAYGDRMILQDNIIDLTYKQQKQQANIYDIEYIEADEWRCKIYTVCDEIVCAKRLRDLSSLLAGYGFIRCHKGYIVNTAMVDKIVSARIFLKSGKDIPLGRAYKKSVRREFKA